MGGHGRCIGMDQNGKRCKKSNTIFVGFHADSEMHNNRVSWVLAPLCPEHRWVDYDDRHAADYTKEGLVPGR